jgi:hypothetical protein
VTTTRREAILFSAFGIVFCLFVVIESALVIIGKVDVVDDGSGQPISWILERVLGIFWFFVGVGGLYSTIIQIQSGGPWVRDDFDRGDDIIEREWGIDFDGFDLDDGGH